MVGRSKSWMHLLLMLACGHALRAQNLIGINPPGMKWSQIDAPTGRIIFPQGLDSLAFRTAAIMAYQQVHDSSMLGAAQLRRVPVIIQNRTTLPGGFSTPAPWRNEYTMVGPQNLFIGPVPWNDPLVAHEYRHSQQFGAAYGGMGLAFRILMGRTGWLFNTLLTQPLWLREGDAVLSETILTNGGRGRMPAFHMETRALRLAGYHYNYEKNHFGSFRDFVPNPYRMGYYMVTKARREHGDGIWTRVLEDTYRRKIIWQPLSRSLKEHTGYTTRRLSKAAMHELDTLWTTADRAVGTVVGTDVPVPTSRTYTNYRYPHYLPDGRILALRSGLDMIAGFVILDHGREERLFLMGIYTEDHATMVVEGQLVAWAESAFHPRWTGVDYSVIKIHDSRTGRTRHLTHRSRCFSPAPSPDGKQVAVVEADLMGRYALVVLDAATGAEVARHRGDPGVQYTQLRWMPGEQRIIAVRLDARGNAIVIVDPWRQQEEEVLAPEHMSIARPFVAGGSVFFSSSIGGIENIHAIGLSDRQRVRLTDERFGAYDPVISTEGTTLLYSAYTADGYRLRSLTLEPLRELPIPADTLGDMRFHLDAQRFEGNATPVPAEPAKYPVRKYHAFTDGLFNPYGWFPVPSPPEYGLEVYTQNIMSTLQGTLGGAYNTYEQRFRSYVRFSYAALFPIIDGEWQNNGRHSASLISSGDGLTEIDNEWLENKFSASIRLPFNLTQGSHNTTLSLTAGYDHYAVSQLDPLDLVAAQPATDADGWHGDLLFSRLQTRARQFVQPRWGQTLAVEHRVADDLHAERSMATCRFFFPGVLRTHSFNVQGTFRTEKVIEAYRFLNDRLMPRGISPRPLEEIAFAQFNYELPVWYPDLATGSIAFFQRVRVNAFADLTRSRVAANEQDWATGGLELSIDLRLMRLFQMSILMRYTAALTTGVPLDRPFEFLVMRFELVN
ncbi:MAG: hypothetical protein KA352_02615 [Flavobacteriales bacterium]|nr:hypothetical protein [Flavobacteriales bacterium]